MEKLLIIPALLLAACSAYRVDLPKYTAKDTVVNTHTKITYVIDSATYRKGKRQVFYTAHNSDGTVQWLPENSIKKY